MGYELKQDLKQSQNIKQLQRLIMSPQMQQALNLLQLPILELSALIEMEIEQNPILESSLEEEKSEQEIEDDENELEEESKESLDKDLNFDEKDLQILQQLDEDFKDYFNESGSYTASRSSSDDKYQTYLESSIVAENTLQEHLMQQAREIYSSEDDLKLAEAIIGNLDDNGLLGIPLEEIAVLNNSSQEKLKKYLKQIQQFDPAGIAATTLQESLLIQLERKNKQNTLAYEIIHDYFHDLIKNKIPNIQKNLNCSTEEISRAIKEEIAKLNFHPGSSFLKENNHAIVPDLVIDLTENGGLKAIIPNEYIPTIHLNQKYLKMMQDENLPADVKDFIKQKLLSAKWLLKNIDQRNSTLENIGNYLIEKQATFFQDPTGKLVPLTMKSLAEILQVHESTIARAVSNKYLSCNRGIFAIRSFFTNEIETDKGALLSSKTVKDLVEEIIKTEDKNSPFSDQVISNKIKALGIHCARRTVTKYRILLNIGNTQQRKKFD